MALEVNHLEPTYGIVEGLNCETENMEFSSIGAEDSLEEAKSRLIGNDLLVVWGQEKIIGVLTEAHLEKLKGEC